MLLTDILFFFNFCLFAFALPLYLAVSWQIRPERTFLPALILNSMFYYIFAMFHITGIGFPVIYTANILLYVPIFKSWKKLGSTEFIRRISIPGSMILPAVLLLMFCNLADKHFFTWDALSHWGTVVKIFMLDRKLGCEYSAEVLMHASYPPGTCMTSMLVHSCFYGRQFSEGIVIFSHELYNFGVLIYFFSFLQWRHKKQILSFILLMFTAMLLLYTAKCYQLCYTDSPLLLLTALAFYQAMTCEKYRPAEFFMLAVITAWLFMIRNAGWGYAVGVMIIFAFVLIRDRKNIFNAPDSRWKIFAAASVFILPLLLKYSWVYLLYRNQTSLRFGGKEISAGAIYRLFGSATGDGWEITGRFAAKLLTDGFVPAMLLLITSGIILCRKLPEQNLRRAAKTTVIFFSVGFVIFCTTSLFYYIFEFHDTTFPSLKRYLNSFIAIPLLILLLITAHAYAGKEENMKKSFLQKNTVFVPLCILTITIFATLNCLFFSHSVIYRRWREECEKIRKYDSLLLADGIKFTCFSTTGCGLKNFCFNLMYHRNFRAVPYWDPVITDKNIIEREYAVQMTQDELKQSIKQFDYVYLDDPQEDFCRNYAAVFVPEIQVSPANICHRLFRVNEAGFLEPVQL